MSELSKEEYQAAYDAEMAKLSGTAAQATTGTEENKAKDEGQVAAAATPPAAETDPDAKKLAEELERTKKALSDTQRWGHQNAAEIKRIRKELEEKERAANKPQILEKNPGLEDAIRYVAQPTDQKPNPQSWMETVATALPDIEDLLQDTNFMAMAAKKRDELGDTWMNPIVATRELSDLRTQFVRDRAVAEAVEKARKDFEAKQKKATAMQVPSGGGSASSGTVDEAERIRTMSSADFAKMRAKTLGF